MNLDSSASRSLTARNPVDRVFSHASYRFLEAESYLTRSVFEDLSSSSPSFHRAAAQAFINDLLILAILAHVTLRCRESTV